MEIKKCIITAAGYGTRMLPITKTIGKEMLNIIDVPAIFYQVKEAYLSGIKEIIFIVRKENKSLLKNFFTKNKKLEEIIKNNPEKQKLLTELYEIIDNIKFHYILQKEKGSYGAVYSARKLLNNEYFAVMFCDDIVDAKIPLLKQLISEHERTNNMIIACKTYNYDEIPNVKIIKYKKENLIDSLIKKEEQQSKQLDMVHGRFIIHTKIFDIKKQLKYHNKELLLPQSIVLFKDEVRSLNYEGEYFNIGSKLGLLKANIHFGLKNKELSNELYKFINNIKK